jgi:hypothetical protein
MNARVNIGAIDVIKMEPRYFCKISLPDLVRIKR